jgi:hypothetical protein
MSTASMLVIKTWRGKHFLAELARNLATGSGSLVLSALLESGERSITDHTMEMKMVVMNEVLMAIVE